MVEKEPPKSYGVRSANLPWTGSCATSKGTNLTGAHPIFVLQIYKWVRLHYHLSFRKNRNFYPGK